MDGFASILRQKGRITMEIVNSLLDLTNIICEIVFISYVWKTMMRINTYITKHEREGIDAGSN